MHTPSPSIRLALGSKQPAKRAAVQEIAPLFWSRWELHCLSVPSGVRAQPLSDEETVAGALARARVVRDSADADYGIGLESGVAAGPLGRLSAVSWAVVVDRDGCVGIGGAERFTLPPAVAERVLHGEELASALRALGMTSTPSEGGTVALLTGGRRQRRELLAIALLHALCDLERQRGRPLQFARSSVAPGGT